MRSLLSLLLLLSGGLLLGQSSPIEMAARATLRQAGATWVVEKGNYFSIRLPAGSPTSGQTPEAFLKQHGPAFGLAPNSELNLQVTKRGVDGVDYLRMTQEINGIPVLGKGITIAVSQGGNILSVSGTLLPSTHLSPAAAALQTNASINDYSQSAKAGLVTKYPHALQWNVAPAGQVWTSDTPWKSTKGSTVLTTIYDVNEPGGHRSERVYINAITGKIVLHHQLHCDLNREQYQDNTNTGSLVWSEGNAFPGSLNADDQEMLLATEEIYNLYNRSFGRNGYDDADGLMRGVSSANLSNCPNASASGNAIRHCDGLVTDDIVGHEWSHNYTGRMNGLIYAYESGALNEAYADIFGESVDLLNDRGLDTDDGTLRTGCNNNSQRWQMGEGSSLGALRDMWRPECRSDPSDRSSSEYHCNESDNGGVHINSGVFNRTYSLLVDGGSNNGVNVGSIGMTKALHIFYHAAANYVGPVTGFGEIASILVQSANDLMGIDLPSLTLLDVAPMASGETISAADIAQLQNAILATELEAQSPCDNEPTLAQNPPAACGDFVSLLSEDWESGTSGWSLVEVPVNSGSWDAKPWGLNTTLPGGRAGQGLFAPDPRVGDCQGDLENGAVHLTSPVINIPADVAEVELRFNHYYSTENDWDGGVMYISKNGSAFTYLPNATFTYNGYDDALRAAPQNDNPAAGLEAFNGSDAASTSGTWGTTIVDLQAAGALPGDNIQVRWSMTHDGCNGWLGWYIDEVEVGYCSSSILPVTYASIDATPVKDHIIVDWRTEVEDQNTGFYIQRRAASEASFRELGFVVAGLRPGSYEFLDYQVSGGITYVYRLRQVDLDGNVHYSAMVSANLEAGRSLAVFPNPTSNGFTILTNTDIRTATLFAVDGRQVGKVSLRGGSARFETKGLKPGIYLLRAGEEVLRIAVR
jgi:bacillolysin